MCEVPAVTYGPAGWKYDSRAKIVRRGRRRRWAGGADKLLFARGRELVRAAAQARAVAAAA